MPTHDVFLSYASLDKTVADAVCHGLEAEGVRCWIAPRDVMPGMDWQQSLLDAIGSARAAVLIFTHNANDSPHVRKEITAAFEAGAVVVPFRLEAVEPQGSLRYHLSGVHWLDAVTPPLEANVKSLATTLKRLVEAPAAGGAASAGPAQTAPGAPANIQPPRSDSSDSAPTIPATTATRPVTPVASAKPPAWAFVAAGVGLIVVLGLAVAMFGGGGSPPSPAAPQDPGAKPQPAAAGDPVATGGVVGPPPPPIAPDTPERAEALLILRTPIEGQQTYAGELATPPGSTPLNAGAAATVSSHQLANALSNQAAEVTLIDAAGCDGHPSIPTARCLTPGQDAAAALRNAGVDPAAPVVFFCHGPSCAWSHTMATAAAAAGWRNVFWYRGGLAAWSEAGGPTEASAPLLGSPQAP